MSESAVSNAWSDWEARFASFLQEQTTDGNAAHDRAHIERVVTSARRLAHVEDAQLEVVVPASWLHDCVVVPKDDPRRAEASILAAETATAFLRDAGYPERRLDAIAHAIEAHSYSGNVAPGSIEAKVVQDADRLDALGAVGIARCFLVGGSLGNTFYHPEDPFCDARDPDDSTYSLDHFYAKLLRLPDTMQTAAGRKEAERRVEFMQSYLDQLATEIGEQ